MVPLQVSGVLIDGEGRGYSLVGEGRGYIYDFAAPPPHKQFIRFTTFFKKRSEMWRRPFDAHVGNNRI